jgi:hypothetical protein
MSIHHSPYTLERPLVSMAGIRNLSSRSLNLLESAEAELTVASNGLMQGHHIAGSEDTFTRALEKGAAILSEQDMAILRRENLLIKVPDSEKVPGSQDDDDTEFTDVAGIKKVCREMGLKEAEGHAFTPVELAVKHFISEQNAVKYINETVLPAWKKNWVQQHKIYDPAKNGAYPLRNMKNEPLHITQIAPRSLPNEYESVYSSNSVKPFFNKNMTPQQRAALYDKLVSCRIFKKTDMKTPQERPLVGQNMVVANKSIAQGTCLGLYGGVQIPEDKIPYNQCDTYLLTGDSTAKQVVDGDNILSRINTVFTPGPDGKPFAQAQKRDYNVETASFEVDLENGQKSFITACFAMKRIKKGEELRLNYGYGASTIKNLFNGGDQ